MVPFYIPFQGVHLLSSWFLGSLPLTTHLPSISQTHNSLLTSVLGSESKSLLPFNSGHFLIFVSNVKCMGELTQYFFSPSDFYLFQRSPSSSIHREQKASVLFLYLLMAEQYATVNPDHMFCIPYLSLGIWDFQYLVNCQKHNCARNLLNWFFGWTSRRWITRITRPYWQFQLNFLKFPYFSPQTGSVYIPRNQE